MGRSRGNAHRLAGAGPHLLVADLHDQNALQYQPRLVVLVERVEGRLAEGEKIKVYSEANPGRAFPVKVAELTSGQMTWSGGMPLGLFKGVRTYRVVPEGDRTRFTMREEYTGPLLPLIWRSMPDLQPSFDKFARGLKARVEGASSA